MLLRQLKDDLGEFRVADYSRLGVVDFQATERMREDDDGFDPPKLRVTLGEKGPNSGGPGVDLSADTSPGMPIDRPLVAPAANASGQSLRLYHHHAAWPDENVIDIPPRAPEHHVIGEPVVIREASEQVSDEPLTEASLADAGEAMADLDAERESTKCGCDSNPLEGWALSQQDDPGSAESNDAGQGKPEALLSPLQIPAPRL
jgi:hypothetical protein